MPTAFISHSTRDRLFVEQTLIPALNSGGIDTWYSRDDIATADHWERTIKAGLERCDWFVIVLSPNATGSEWVKDEVHWAIDNRGGKIVPVLLAECDPIDIHLRLARIQHVDLRDTSGEALQRLLAPFGAAPTAPPEPSPAGRRAADEAAGRRAADRATGRRASDRHSGPRGRRTTDREMPTAKPGVSKLTLFNTAILGCLLLGACGLFGTIVVAIAIPNLFSARVRADEYAAQSVLRSIAVAQEQFLAGDLEGDGEMDYASSTQELLTTGVIAREQLESDAYVFTIESSSAFEWSASATPLDATSGRRSFVIDQDGLIREPDDGR